MKIIRIVLTSVILAGVLQSTARAVVRDNGPASPPITFSDGSVAKTYDHCGDSDLCATIDYPDGDKLFFFSEGAAFCQPYILHFVRTRGTLTVYEFSRTLNHDPVVASAFGTHCGNTQATQMTMDHGLVHLTVDEYTDGSLRFVFAQTQPKS